MNQWLINSVSIILSFSFLISCSKLFILLSLFSTILRFYILIKLLKTKLHAKSFLVIFLPWIIPKWLAQWIANICHGISLNQFNISLFLDRCNFLKAIGTKIVQKFEYHVILSSFLTKRKSSFVRLC